MKPFLPPKVELDAVATCEFCGEDIAKIVPSEKVKGKFKWLKVTLKVTVDNTNKKQ